MTPIAHILGLPFEELALPLLSSGGALWLAVKAQLLGRLRPGDASVNDHEGGMHR